MFRLWAATICCLSVSTTELPRNFGKYARTGMPGRCSKRLGRSSGLFYNRSRTGNSFPAFLATKTLTGLTWDCRGGILVPVTTAASIPLLKTFLTQLLSDSDIPWFVLFFNSLWTHFFVLISPFRTFSPVINSLKKIVRILLFVLVC